LSTGKTLVRVDHFMHYKTVHGILGATG